MEENPHFGANKKVQKFLFVKNHSDKMEEKIIRNKIMKCEFKL